MDGYALLCGLVFLLLYELVYSGIVHFHEHADCRAEGYIYRQLLQEILSKNERLRCLNNCPMSVSDRFSMASEDCSNYASAIVSKASLFADFVVLPCYIVYGCSISLVITAVLTGMSVFLSILNRENKKKLYGYNQEYNESYNYWSNFLWKAVDNLEVIKVFLDKKKIRKEQRRRGEKLDGIQQERLKTYLDMTLIEESSDMIFTLLILCAAFATIAMKRIAASDILAMTESLTVVQKAVFVLPEKIVQLNELESMASRISRFESLEEDRGEIRKTEPLKRFVLKQARFAYGEKEILKGVDFTFEKGKFYILAGASGCGKSTLLKVMAKLIPYRGSVCWNQTELKEINRQALYERLSYQAQAQVFLEGSIRENICLDTEAESAEGKSAEGKSAKGESAEEESAEEESAEGELAEEESAEEESAEEELTEEELTEAELTEAESEKRYTEILKHFFVGDIFEKNGIDDTQVLSFRGAPLSSGEGQMVSMAGILYDPGEVILLDEVFSAVDPAKEQVYFRKLSALAREGKLVILVSHRLTNLDKADEILFMEDGRIRERGSLQELVSLGGRFCEWHEMNRERRSL